MSAITYQPFTTFHDTIKAIVAPEGLAENLIVPFRAYVCAALCDIQTWIKWYQGINVRFITKGDINEFCGTSIFQGPQGRVTQLFAFKPGRDCARYYYKRVSTAEIDCWMERQRCLCPVTDPLSTNIYDSPYCNYVIPGEEACNLPYLSGEEDDCRFKTLADDVRIFAVGPDYQVYAGPRFPCEYMLLLQWQGVNRTWVDNDLVPVDQQLQDAVENFVENRVFMKQNGGSESGYGGRYVELLRALRRRWSDEQSTPEERDCTAAVATLQATFMPAYPTPLFTAALM